MCYSIAYCCELTLIIEIQLAEFLLKRGVRGHDEDVVAVSRQRSQHQFIRNPATNATADELQMDTGLTHPDACSHASNPISGCAQ